jgi:hypothetical protein
MIITRIWITLESPRSGLLETRGLPRGTVAYFDASLMGKEHLTLPPPAIPASPPPKQDLKHAKKGNFFNDYSFLSFV